MEREKEEAKFRKREVRKKRVSACLHLVRGARECLFCFSIKTSSNCVLVTDNQQIFFIIWKAKWRRNGQNN